MKWNVTIGDKTTRVELPQDISSGQVYSAKVGDRTLQFRFDGTTLSEVSGDSGNRQINLRLRAPKVSRVDSEFAVDFEFERGVASGQVKSHVEVYTPGSGHKAKKQKSGVVRSEITGKVLRVMTVRGAAVNVGDPICVIEAMKMENKIFAATGGIVEEVFVQDGSLVKAGDKLFSIIPKDTP